MTFDNVHPHPTALLPVPCGYTDPTNEVDMNSKRAKLLRKKAGALMVDFVKDKVLSKDLTDGLKYDKIIAQLPERVYMRNRKTLGVGVATQRWFIKKVKKNPGITYKQILKEIYGETGGV